MYRVRQDAHEKDKKKGGCGSHSVKQSSCTGHAKETKQFGIGGMAVTGMIGALSLPAILGFVLYVMGIVLAAKCPVKASTRGAEIAAAVITGPMYLIVRAFLPSKGFNKKMQCVMPTDNLRQAAARISRQVYGSL